MAETKNFFNPDLIARILRLELTARRVVDGFLTGKNRSSRHGFSVEFVEHREYTPGDDLRHLDWKVLGRMDRYYIKRYEEETNITAVILLDASGSMTYGSGAISKFEVGAYAASALSYLLHRQRDAVGLAFSMRTCARSFRRRRSELPSPTSRPSSRAPSRAAKRAFTEVLKRVSQRDPASRAVRAYLRLLRAPRELRERTPPLRPPRPRRHRSASARRGGADVSFPPETRSSAASRIRASSLPSRTGCANGNLESLERFIEGVKKATLASAYDYQMVTTGGDLEPALAALLSARAAPATHANARPRQRFVTRALPLKIPWRRVGPRFQ
jgi:uncharacterized protein (DUF58 family)